MLVDLKSFTGSPITRFNKFLSGRIRRNLSGIGVAEFIIPITDPKITAESVKFLNRVEIYIQNTKQFVGIVTKVKVKSNQIEFSCVDWIGFAQYRQNRDVSSTTGDQLSTIFQDAFDSADLIYPLPFVINKNDVTTIAPESVVTRGRSLKNILDSLVAINGEYRSIGNEVDYSEQTGVLLGGLLRYDASGQISSNILDRERTTSIDDFFNGLLSRNPSLVGEYLLTEDAASIAANGLIESFALSSGSHSTKTNGAQERAPSIIVDGTKIDRINANVGDRQKVIIIPALKFLSVEFVGVIKSIEIVLNGGRFDPKVEIVQDLRSSKDDGLISKILEQISKKVKNLETT